MKRIWSDTPEEDEIVLWMVVQSIEKRIRRAWRWMSSW